MGLVATVPRGADELIIGEGSYAVLGRTAEVGFTVAEAWQGRGVATRLLQHLAGIARDHGVAEFREPTCSRKTHACSRYSAAAGFQRRSGADSLMHVTLALDSPAAPR